MSKNDLIILANIFSDMNDFIDQIIPPKSWMSTMLRRYLFLYRDELVKRIGERKTLKCHESKLYAEFQRVAKTKTIMRLERKCK